MARKLCIICGIRKGTTANGKDFADMCDPCYQEAGWENTHSDGDHEGIIAGDVVYGTTTHKTRAAFEAWLKEEQEGCWICFPELNLAKKPAKAQPATKEQGFRRPQLNHKGHAHPQTPKARRECKAAFWAGVPEESLRTVTPELFSAWAVVWDAKMAPQTEAKSTKAPGYTLVSTGPKHGVVAQLKAAKPESFRRRVGKVERQLAKDAGLIK